jgi:hypothetical protein
MSQATRNDQERARIIAQSGARSEGDESVIRSKHFKGARTALQCKIRQRIGGEDFCW